MPKLSINTIDYDEGSTDTESNATTPTITIPEHLRSLSSTMTNYANMSDGDFGGPFLNKTKRQFTQKTEKAFSLGVKLIYFKSQNQGTFTKMFIYSKDPQLEPDNVLIKILSEVYYHIEFSKLQESCGFRVPKLLNYGFIDRNNDTSINIGPNEFIFYIRMEDVDALPVTKLNELYNDNELLDKCIDIEKEVDRIDTCLQKYNLHHNDLHTDNVMISKKGEIIIIDFGESSHDLQNPFFTVNFCNKFTKQGGATTRKRRRVAKKHGLSKKHGLYKKRGVSKKRGLSKKRRISRKRMV